MADSKGFFESLTDFSFQHFITKRYANLLYGMHLLLGLIVAIGFVFSGFQASQSQGLLDLILALVGYFLWIICVRVVLECLVTIFRTADHIARVSSPERES